MGELHGGLWTDWEDETEGLLVTTRNSFKVLPARFEASGGIWASCYDLKKRGETKLCVYQAKFVDKGIVHIKGALWGLRQFLITESPLKMKKNVFYFTLKVLFVLKIFKFLPWLSGHVEKTARLGR